MQFKHNFGVQRNIPEIAHLLVCETTESTRTHTLRLAELTINRRKSGFGIDRRLDSRFGRLHVLPVRLDPRLYSPNFGFFCCFVVVYTEAEAEATHLSHEAGPRCSTTCTWPEQKGKTVSASAAAASRVPVSRGDRAASCTDSRDNTPAVRVCVRGGPYTKPTETPIQTYTDIHETSETTYCEHCGSPPTAVRHPLLQLILSAATRLEGLKMDC